MRLRIAPLLLTLPLLALYMLNGCRSAPRAVAPTLPASRVYNGTASVGGFMTITIDSSAPTIAYTDVSNSQNWPERKFSGADYRRRERADFAGHV